MTQLTEEVLLDPEMEAGIKRTGELLSMRGLYELAASLLGLARAAGIPVEGHALLLAEKAEAFPWLTAPWHEVARLENLPKLGAP